MNYMSRPETQPKSVKATYNINKVCDISLYTGSCPEYTFFMFATYMCQFIWPVADELQQLADGNSSK